MGDEAYYAAAERRIEYMTLGLGAAGAICAAVMWTPRAALGVAAGAVLAWLNFRWMKQGVGRSAGPCESAGGRGKSACCRREYISNSSGATFYCSPERMLSLVTLDCLL